MRFHLSPQLYSRIWIAAALVPTCLAVYTVYLLEREVHSLKTFCIFLLLAGLVLMRLWQFVAGFFGWYFTEEIFGLWRIIFTVILVAATTLYVWLSAIGGLPCFMWIGITLASDILLWIIDWYVVGAEEFQQYMLGENVVECLRQIAVRDSLPFSALYSWDAKRSLFKKYFRYLGSLHLFSKESYSVHAMWARLKSYFRYPSTGAIALAAHDNLSNSGLEMSANTASRTPQSFKQRSAWTRFKLYFCYSSTGPIALPVDDEVHSNSDLELGSSSSSSSRAPQSMGNHTPWTPPAQLSKNLTHWSMLASEWDTSKALWVTADSANMRASISGAASDLFSPAAWPGAGGVAVVDLSQAESVHWPLIHGLALASREYRTQLGKDPPTILSETFAAYPFSRAFDTTTWYPQPSYHYDDDKKVITDFLIRPINQAYKELIQKAKKQRKKMKNADLENEHTPQSVVVPRAFLVVHGLRSKAHAEEVCEVVESLQRRLKKNMQRDFRIGIVVVTKSTLLRHVADSPAILDRFCTMHVPGGDGPLIYSGVTPSPPMLYEKIFLLLVDGLHRLGGVDAERIWPRLLQISEEGTAWRLELEGVPLSTHTIFAKLFGALRARKEITECLSEMRGMTRALVPKKMIEDHIKIGSVLQELFVLNTYQQEIESVNKEHAGAVLNITHKILDDGLPPNDVVPNWNQFSRRAHRLLNTLAAHLDMLPEELSVNNVLLLSNHIVKSGGFSNVYRGRYTKADGEEVEIALKVLRIFDDQTADSRRLLYEKFNKEALLWHHMKHPNVVHFLGVDSTTFPSPARAMVSPWMAQGSVLKYIADPENSPVAPYAIELLCDVIEGLRYLHSSNVVHGDLCGRNILINEHGEACLTDFGLAGFIESDTTNRAASTRGGSIRWMPPELLVVAPGTQFRRSLASDIWAFGCVCGEIWTEGILPFATEQEMAIIFLFSSHDSATEDESPSGWPYQQRPADKVGNLMPERLWELVQWCWKYDAAARPSTGVIADMLSEMNPGKRRKGGEDSKVVAEANAAVGAARGVAGGSGMRRVRDEDEDGDGVVSSASATSMSSDEEDLTPPASSAPKNKGKQRAQAMVPLPSRAVHFTNADEPSDSDLFVARFGPLPEGMEFGAGHEDVEFLEIFEALAGRVGRSGALAEPRSVHRFDNTHLDLHFKTAMEANNFAMTWMNRRFEPYLECEAFVVDID